MALMMPVNLRPQEWRLDVIANFASYVTVRLAEDEQAAAELGRLYRDVLTGAGVREAARG